MRISWLKKTPSGLLRFLLFQMTWWLLVLSSKIEEALHFPHFGSALSVVVSALSIFWILRKNLENRWNWILVALAVLGFFLDSLWITMGFIETKVLYQADPISVGPLWLLGLWLAFVAASFSTVTESFSNYLKTKKQSFATLTVLGLLGAVSGPISYLAGKPLGVMQIESSGVIAIALEWMILFPAIVVVISVSKNRSKKKPRS